jgi:hypothetical protein
MLTVLHINGARWSRIRSEAEDIDRFRTQDLKYQPVNTFSTSYKLYIHIYIYIYI